MTREELEARVAELEHLNHRLANQIAGYGDRMQETLGGIIRNAKAEALREAADTMDSDPEFRDPLRLKSDWLRTRADNLEKS